MKISVLTDNLPGAGLASEHGFSAFIEFDGKKILFDTGQSDLFLRNSMLMNIHSEEADAIVLSHGHHDHGNGLSFLDGGTLICHPGCFIKRYRKRDHSYLGLKNTKEEISEKFILITTAKPYHISERIIFLGEIPRVTGFESQNTNFILEDDSPDFITDDSALALLHDDGLFIITGCGHAGIVNTIEHTIKVTGISKLLGVMGGFHLKEYNLQTKETIDYLRRKYVRYVLPSHCTSGAALDAFHDNFSFNQIRTGDIFTF